MLISATELRCYWHPQRRTQDFWGVVNIQLSCHCNLKFFNSSTTFSVHGLQIYGKDLQVALAQVEHHSLHYIWPTCWMLPYSAASSGTVITMEGSGIWLEIRSSMGLVHLLATATSCRGQDVFSSLEVTFWKCCRMVAIWDKKRKKEKSINTYTCTETKMTTHNPISLSTIFLCFPFLSHMVNKTNGCLTMIQTNRLVFHWCTY